MGATAEACSRPAAHGTNGDTGQAEVQAKPWNNETVEQYKTSSEGSGALDTYKRLDNDWKTY